MITCVLYCKFCVNDFASRPQQCDPFTFIVQPETDMVRSVLGIAVRQKLNKTIRAVAVER